MLEKQLERFISEHCGAVAFGIAPVTDLTPEEIDAQMKVNSILAQYSPLMSADMPVMQPRDFIDNARAVIVLGFNFYFGRIELPGSPPRGEIMNFYVNPACLDSIIGQTEKVIGFLEGQGYTAMQIAAGISVKRMAALSGIGAYGKNAIIQVPGMGSWLGLNLIFTDAPLEPSPVLEDPCGTCSLCQQACPTGALDTPYTCDIERCLTLHMVYGKKSIPRDIREKAGTCIAQCNICLDVCPKNKGLTIQQDVDNPHDLVYPEIAPLLNISDEEYQRRFNDTFFEFMFMDKKFLQRNTAVALGNYGSADFIPALARALATQPEEIVREHAAWALGKIGTASAHQSLTQALTNEPSAAVRAEIQQALEQF